MQTFKFETFTQLIYFLIMRGLIAINVKSNDTVINDHPLLMYYSGDEDSILNAFKSNEDFKEYLIKNTVHLNTYENCTIYYITYFSDDVNDTPEDTSKQKVALSEVIPISDVYELLMYDALDVSFGTHDISEVKKTGVARSTIINAVRHASIQSGLTHEHCSVLVKMIQTLI